LNLAATIYLIFFLGERGISKVVGRDKINAGRRHPGHTDWRRRRARCQRDRPPGASEERYDFLFIPSFRSCLDWAKLASMILW
jgi:hypothetical protein